MPMAWRITEGESTAQMKESGHCHTPATLPPEKKKKKPVIIGKEPGWATQTIWTLLRRQTFCLYW